MRRFDGLAFGAAVMFSALAAAAMPEPALAVDAWSDAHRKISAESGARITGDWSTATAPYLRRPMIVAGVDHPSASVWARMSAKVGKTQIALNAMFHAIDTAPRSMMVVCPSLQKSQDFEREVFTPNANDTPKVAASIMGMRSRSGDGSTTRNKRFRGGFLKIVSAASEKELQQSDIGLLVLEEPSSYPADVGGRGSPIRQARARTFAWADDAKEIGTGTPKFVGDCVVSDQVEAGTQEMPYLPCPHCGWLQALAWENMERVRGRPYFVCQAPECGTLIGHEHKLGMLAAFDRLHPDLQGWVPCFRSADPADPEQENPANPRPPTCFPPEDLAKWQARDTEGRDPSFDGVWQAYSPFTTWDRIYREYDETGGDVDKLVSFYQQVLGRPFEAAYERPQHDLLWKSRDAMAKVAGVRRGFVPEWACAVVGACDVQGYGLVWAVYAVGPGPGYVGRRMARIDGGLIAIPPVDPRAWAELSEVTQRTWRSPHLRPLGIDRFAVDTGGHHTNEVLRFCSGRPNVWAIKGKPNDRAALPVTSGTKAKAKFGPTMGMAVPLFLIGTHNLKKEVYFGLKQALLSVEAGEPLPGAMFLDDQATEDDFRQLTAEVLMPKDPAKKRKEEAWVRQPAGQANEQLDLAVYSRALAWAFLVDRMTEADWRDMFERRRGDPMAADQLPLEAAWSPRAELAPAAEPATPPAAPPTGPRAALLAMARRNRGDDA